MGEVRQQHQREVQQDPEQTGENQKGIEELAQGWLRRDREARWFTFLFYSRHALRGDLADVQIKKRGLNYVHKKGSRWHMHVGDHKTAKSHGAIELELDEVVSKAMNQYLPYVRAKTDHGFLLSTKRYGVVST